MKSDSQQLLPTQSIHDMFQSLPARYDLLNQVMTWGMDQRWRQEAAEECLADNPQRVLDLGCGTGDFTIFLAKLAKKEVHITGSDFCQPMLDIARNKLASASYASSATVSLVRADAASLPFANEHFDAIGISFAFRNLTFQNSAATAHLSQIARVLKPGGRLVIVECSQPQNRTIRWCYHLYLRALVAKLAGMLSGQKEAYRYLAESARQFYDPATMARLLTDAGLGVVRYRPRLWGAIGLTVAIK